MSETHHEEMEQHASQAQELQEAKQIIRELLVSLHSRGGKQKIADKARAFLGLKPGEKVARGEDWWNLRYPR